MYEFKVLTRRNLDFLDKDQRPVKGQQLWLLGESNDPQWNGYEVLKLWIPAGHGLEATVSQLRMGDAVKVDFDRRGKPLTIVKV